MRSHRRILRALPLAVTLAALCAPAFAGNYAEGDPRPQPFVSQVSAAQVAGDTLAWVASAPALGYPEGNPRPAELPSQKTREQVDAEARAWVASGMGQVAYGDAPPDSLGPTFQKAQAALAGAQVGTSAAAIVRQ